jgi:branched-chain amino acid transport system substrate-binding protein
MLRNLIFAVSLLVSAACAARAEVLIGLAAPLTGPYSWAGAGTQEGAELAVDDLNKAGGVLGRPIEMITVDDYCAGDQAVAAAKKLVEAGVVAVFGHQCSGAAIPASKIYAEAGILMLSTFATSPKLTEQGLRNVFRMVGRDDVQGKIAGDLLATRFGNKSIAILHDSQAYGEGIAEETRKRLNERGVSEVIFAAIEPGRVDYSDVVREMQKWGVEVLYYGGYMHEAALLLRQAQESGLDLQLVAGDGISNEDFALIAGEAADGTLMTYPPDPRVRPDAALLAERFTCPGVCGGQISTYAALQAWGQAVRKARTFETRAVAEALRSHEFETVLGRIGFDDKGDVTGYDTFIWYVWRDGGYASLDRPPVSD